LPEHYQSVCGNLCCAVVYSSNYPFTNLQITTKKYLTERRKGGEKIKKEILFFLGVLGVLVAIYCFKLFSPTLRSQRLSVKTVLGVHSKSCWLFFTSP
jgi:hypothetical protein